MTDHGPSTSSVSLYYVMEEDERNEEEKVNEDVIINKEEIVFNNTEQKQDFDSVCHALNVLCRLADMGSTIYQMTLSGPEQHQQLKTNDDEMLSFQLDSSISPSAFQCQDQLDQIGRSLQHEVAYRTIGKLAQSIHRFQSNIALLQINSDQQTREIHLLHEEINSLRDKNEQLERYQQIAFDRNEKLASQLAKTSKEKKSLIKHVKKFVNEIHQFQEQQKELEEINTVFRLQAHEQILLNAKSTKSNSTNLQSMDSSESSIPINDYSTMDLSSSEHDGNTSTIFFIESADESPACLSDSDTTSVATSIKTSPASWPKLRFSVDFKKHTVAPSGNIIAQGTYTLKYSAGSPLGIEIKALPMDAKFITTATSSAAQNKKVPLKGILTAEFLEADRNEDCSTVNSTRNSKIEDQSRKSLPFSLGFQLDSFLARKNEQHNLIQSSPIQALEISDVRNMFVVSGYCEPPSTSDNSQQKPEVGDRIVSINGVPVDSSWTLSYLLTKLQKPSSGSVAFDYPCYVTFEKKSNVSSNDSELNESIASVSDDVTSSVDKVKHSDRHWAALGKGIRNLASKVESVSYLKSEIDTVSPVCKKESEISSDSTGVFIRSSIKTLQLWTKDKHFFDVSQASKP